MNERSANRGPNWALLLLIPAVVIIAKGAKRRRAMWASSWGAPGSVGYGFGHHHGSGWDADADPDQRPAFRLPPKIEWMLDTWHTRAHQTLESQTSGSAEAPTTPEPPKAPASPKPPTP